MRVSILLFGLGLLGASCVPEYDEVQEDELISLDLKAEVESIKVDFANLRDRGIYVNNNGERIGFPIYAEWLESTPIPGVACSVKDTIALCSQELPTVGDSLYKEKGSRWISLIQIKNGIADSILIISRQKMEKATATKTRSP